MESKALPSRQRVAGAEGQKGRSGRWALPTDPARRPWQTFGVEIQSDPKNETQKKTMKKRTKKASPPQAPEAETETSKILRRAMLANLKLWGCQQEPPDDISFEALAEFHSLLRPAQDEPQEHEPKLAEDKGGNSASEGEQQ